MAHDIKTGAEHVVTDLKGQDPKGADIHGFAISPDRKRIVIASYYGGTDADIATTGQLVRRIWTLASDGTDFVRLTPPYPYTPPSNTLEVGYPMYTGDAAKVIYDLGSFVGGSGGLSGGTRPWTVTSAGGGVPDEPKLDANCSISTPARNPKTGEVLFHHSVCVSSADEGIWLYPASLTGGAPKQLVASTLVTNASQVSTSLNPIGWAVDGSGFLFTGQVQVDRGGTQSTAVSLLLYDMQKGAWLNAVTPPDGLSIFDATVAPDGSAVVYCIVDQNHASNLHVVDLTKSPATDTPITTDGKSCDPSF
jgi:hypothetical protein